MFQQTITEGPQKADMLFIKNNRDKTKNFCLNSDNANQQKMAGIYNNLSHLREIEKCIYFFQLFTNETIVQWEPG
jgi:hypothetical protein